VPADVVYVPPSTIHTTNTSTHNDSGGEVWHHDNDVGAKVKVRSPSSGWEATGRLMFCGRHHSQPFGLYDDNNDRVVGVELDEDSDYTRSPYQGRDGTLRENCDGGHPFCSIDDRSTADTTPHAHYVYFSSPGRGALVPVAHVSRVERLREEVVMKDEVGQFTAKDDVYGTEPTRVLVQVNGNQVGGVIRCGLPRTSFLC
jgi:hypothetical protein